MWYYLNEIKDILFIQQFNNFIVILHNILWNYWTEDLWIFRNKLIHLLLDKIAYGFLNVHLTPLEMWSSLSYGAVY